MKRSKPVLILLAFAVLLLVLWCGTNMAEMADRERNWTPDPYMFCGNSLPETLPDTVRVGFYEEFPNPWRLAQLRHIDFPISLAVAAPSREAFIVLRDTIRNEYPMVHEVYYWPVLTKEEGYYLGSWSNPAAIQRASAHAEDLPVLWDLEMPLGFQSLNELSPENWKQNKPYINQWLKSRTEDEPAHIWRSHPDLGINPMFLQLIGMQFDPNDYSAVKLHLDLYHVGKGFTEKEMWRMMRCGVEKYGNKFIPSLGVLNDGEGSPSYFVPDEILLRDLTLARQAGASEVWLFGVNGITSERAAVIRQTLVDPLTNEASGERKGN